MGIVICGMYYIGMVVVNFLEGVVCFSVDVLGGVEFGMMVLVFIVVLFVMMLIMFMLDVCMCSLFKVVNVKLELVNEELC